MIMVRVLVVQIVGDGVKDDVLGGLGVLVMMVMLLVMLMVVMMFGAIVLVTLKVVMGGDDGSNGSGDGSCNGGGDNECFVVAVMVAMVGDGDDGRGFLTVVVMFLGIEIILVILVVYGDDHRHKLARILEMLKNTQTNLFFLIEKLNLAAVIGGVIAFLITLIVIGVVLWYVCYIPRRKYQAAANENDDEPDVEPEEETADQPTANGFEENANNHMEPELNDEDLREKNIETEDSFV